MLVLVVPEVDLVKQLAAVVVLALWPQEQEGMVLVAAGLAVALLLPRILVFPLHNVWEAKGVPMHAARVLVLPLLQTLRPMLLVVVQHNNSKGIPAVEWLAPVVVVLVERQDKDATKKI